MADHHTYGEQVASNITPLKWFEMKCEKGMNMSLQLQIEEMPDHLVSRFTGMGVAEEVWRQFELIAEHCKRANKNKLLFDFTEANGEVSLADRYFLGEHAQIFTRYRLKVATVERPERIDPQRFGEMVAQTRRVNVHAFTTVEDALEWLLK